MLIMPRDPAVDLLVAVKMKIKYFDIFAVLYLTTVDIGWCAINLWRKKSPFQLL